MPDPVTPLTAAGRELYSLVTNEASVLDYEGVAVRIRAIEQEAAALAHPSDTADAAGEGLADRRVILAYRRHLERGCECPRWPECAPHDAKEWGGGEPDTCSKHEHPAARATRDGTALDVERWMEAVSDSLAATTEGTDWSEAPEPSDEPGSPYVRRLTNELLSRLHPAEYERLGR